MASHDYTFITRWRVRGRQEEVSRVLRDVEAFPRWWPSVYLDVREVRKGDERGVGREVDLWTKGWLPYTLRWRLRVTESRGSAGFSLEATGDFVGRGVWRFEQDGEHVNVAYDWRIRAEKPLLRYLSFVLKPIFAANHHWAMAQGEESLKEELERRRAGSSRAQPTRPVSR